MVLKQPSDLEIEGPDKTYIIDKHFAKKDINNEKDYRVALQLVVELYYIQLLQGCGNSACRHPLCIGMPPGEGTPKLSELSAKVLAMIFGLMTRNYMCTYISRSFVPKNAHEFLESVNLRKDISSYPVYISCATHQSKNIYYLIEGETVSTPCFSFDFYKGNIHSFGTSVPKKAISSLDISEKTSQNQSTSTTIFENFGSQMPLQRFASSIIDLESLRSREMYKKYILDVVRSNFLPLLKKNNNLGHFFRSMNDIGKLPNAGWDVYLKDLRNISGDFETQTKYFGLPFLTLDFIEALLRCEKIIETEQNISERFWRFETEYDLEFLKKSVKYVFSNSNALCFSFLSSNANNVYKSSGIDISSVNKAYKILNLLEPVEHFRDVIIECTYQLLVDDVIKLKNSKSEKNPVFMRKLIIILENPYLQVSPNAASIVKLIAKIITSLDKKNIKILLNWMYAISLDSLEKYVKLVNTSISKYFLPKKQDPISPIEDLLKLQRLFLILNARRSSDNINKNKLPELKFYNEDISEKLDYKAQYIIFVRSRKYTSFRNKSIFSYIFLFNPQGKVRLLRVATVFRMLEKYSNAFANLEMINRTCMLFDNEYSILDCQKNIGHEVCPFFMLDVRRDHLVQDTFNNIKNGISHINKPLKVKFVGNGEIGVDQGGIQKEFFQILVDTVFNPGYGMFVYSEETRFSYINGSSFEKLSNFNLFGIVLGLALYNGIVLNITFPRAIYKQLLRIEPNLDDFSQLFPLIGNSLRDILEYEGQDFEEVFMLRFSIYREQYGSIKIIPLIENGENIPVTKENRREYVKLYVNEVLSKGVRKQLKAYRKGFYSVIDERILWKCTPRELELMVCGDELNSESFIELKNNTIYTNGYTENDEIIIWLWDILLNETTLRQKKLFLIFCTASERVPLGGFSRLKFTVSKNGVDTCKLPTAITCFCTLMLPKYSSRELLSSSLLTAIECCNGFGLV